jgi:glycerate 2-kinase
MQGNRHSIERLRWAAREIFQEGVRAADPRRAVRENLEIGANGLPVVAGQGLSSTATLRVVALGKAGVSMAEAASEMLPAEIFSGPGVVTVNPENHRDLDRFDVFPSGHPVPDAVGVAAAVAVQEYLVGVREGDALLTLISGGGSALLPAPAAGISLNDKIETTRLLLASGAPIEEVNTVRKHLSTLKGGGLARLAYPGRVEALILSDVVGDDPSVVASGPTAPDPTTFQEVTEILVRYGLSTRVPSRVRTRIAQGVGGDIMETPAAGDPVFDQVVNRLVGTNSRSLAVARRRAEALGFETVVVPHALVGEARDAASVIENAARREWQQQRPLAILAGGETTVTLEGGGRGGRSQEMALALALRLDARPLLGEWAFLSGGTDGRDGPTEAAGGLVDVETVDRVRRASLNPLAELDDNNSYAALSAAGDLLITGPTGTNVADLQVLLLEPDPQA